MSINKRSKIFAIFIWVGALALLAAPAPAQLIDKTKAPNIANVGIKQTSHSKSEQAADTS